MQLQRLMLSGFRSWESGVLDFTPGLTLITGLNGSGKTSIRMAAEYAVQGKVKSLSKKQLVKESSKSPLKVTLECVRDGKPFVITRTSARTTLQVGDETGVSVRESNFMAALEMSMQHSFLSQEIQAFVDMQEYKRKEMMDTLIPEVEVLRGTCVPYLKNVSKHVAEKKYSISANIQQFSAVAEEIRASVYNAAIQIENEKARQDAILAQQASQLPYTEEENAEHISARATVKSSIKELEKYMGELSGWLEYADSVSGSDHKWASEVQRCKTTLEMLHANKAELDAILVSDTLFEQCVHCNSPLQCKVCGEAVTLADKKQWVEKNLATTKEKISACEARLRTSEGELAKLSIPDIEAVHKARADMRTASASRQTLYTQLESLNSSCTAYANAKANIEHAMSIALSDTVLDSMRDNVAKLQEREATIRKKVEVKNRTWGTLNTTHNRIDRAIDAMHTTLPALYFDRLLSKLTLACNYLLERISDKRIDMRADDKGIFLSVSGKDFNQLSFGEKQRVRVAITLAFSLLAVSSDTLFLDEVFDSALDAEGVVALGELLSGTMLQWYPKIIVVTHNMTLAAALNPDRVIHITKDGDTSRMEIAHVSK